MSSRFDWVHLLKRVFFIDLEHCPSCHQGALRIIAAITSRPVVIRILASQAVFSSCLTAIKIRIIISIRRIKAKFMNSVSESTSTMTTQDILQTLQAFQRSHADEFGILRLGLFGSATHNAEREDSDIDIVVEIADPDMFKLIGIRQELELCLHRSVDLIRYRPSMNAFLKKRIDQEAIYV